MEMGQDAVQVCQGEEQHQEATGCTTQEIEQQQQQAFIATCSEQFTQSSQAVSMLFSNVVTTSGTEPPALLASILQDVVSGMQSGAGSVPAAIITDPNSFSGFFLVVNLNVVLLCALSLFQIFQLEVLAQAEQSVYLQRLFKC